MEDKFKDSRGGSIPNQAVGNLLMLWIFTIVWMAGCVKVVTPLVRDALRTGDRFKLLALAFPAVGLGMLLWAVQRSWRVWKFGQPVLHLQMAAAPGAELAGVIHVERAVFGDATVKLRLQCIQRLRHPGTTNRTTERAIWQGQELQRANNVGAGSEGTEIPVRFRIPANAECTSGFDPQREILWRLEARCHSGFVGYFARFEVPVGICPADDEPAPVSEAPPALEGADVPEPWAESHERGITCEALAGGGFHVHLAAARRKPIVPTVVGLLFSGCGVAVALWGANDLMQIITWAVGSVLLLIGGLFLYIAIWLWLISQDVMVQRGSIVTEYRALLMRWRRTFDSGDIQEVVCKVDGESSRDGASPTVYHGIQLTTRDGRSIWLASNISRNDYAAWITNQINAALCGR